MDLCLNFKHIFRIHEAWFRPLLKEPICSFLINGNIELSVTPSLHASVEGHDSVDEHTNIQSFANRI